MRRQLVFFGVLVAFLVAVIVTATARPRGVQVTVTNWGPEPLGDVVVHVTGNSYRLGTLEVGQSQKALVKPSSESAVEVTFTDGAGEQVRLNAGGYFEGKGYEGTIDIELKDEEIVRSDHRIHLWPSWL
jgi:hypothetical protein